MAPVGSQRNRKKRKRKTAQIFITFKYFVITGYKTIFRTQSVDIFIAQVHDKFQTPGRNKSIINISMHARASRTYKSCTYHEEIEQIFTISIEQYRLLSTSIDCNSAKVSNQESQIYIYTYTGCPRRNGQNFGRVFLMLKYTDITQNTYIQS